MDIPSNTCSTWPTSLNLAYMHQRGEDSAAVAGRPGFRLPPPMFAAAPLAACVGSPWSSRVGWRRHPRSTHFLQ
uniref:Uncharacterized protein n=1 Tax=Arundo donax TaxID=35708 RepID=A0A0A9CLR9_ARUDO